VGRQMGAGDGGFRPPIYCQGHCESSRPANASPQTPTEPASAALVLLQRASGSALLVTQSFCLDMTMQYTLASTPSDRRATKNAIAALRRKDNDVTFKYDQKPDEVEGPSDLSAMLGIYHEAQR